MCGFHHCDEHFGTVPGSGYQEVLSVLTLSAVLRVGTLAVIVFSVLSLTAVTGVGAGAFLSSNNSQITLLYLRTTPL